LREPALLGEVGKRGKIKCTAASSWLRASMGARITVTTESTGARAMAANDVSRSMPSLSRFFKSPDVRHSLVQHAAMTATAQASHLSAPAAAGSTWPSRTLRALTHLAGLHGVRGPRHKTPQNLNFWQALSSCAASAARTQAKARSQCQGPWHSKREGGHALPPDGSGGQSFPLCHHPPTLPLNFKKDVKKNVVIEQVPN